MTPSEVASVLRLDLIDAVQARPFTPMPRSERRKRKGPKLRHTRQR